jgi:Ca-activated chloride channel family protein
MAVGFTLVPARGLLLLVLLAIAAATLAAAQQNQSGLLVLPVTSAHPNADFKIVRRVDEVNLRFTVTDSHGHFQNQLGPQDFQVLDNHQPPEAIHFFEQQSTLPMRVGIVIDISSSVASSFKFEQKAASIFLQKVLRPDYDEAFVVTFDEKVRLLEDWTSDPKTALNKVYALRAGGNTALYDAVVFACDKLRDHPADVITRPVIVLITDGDDNSSKSLFYDAQQAAARADVILFALSTNVVDSEHYPKGEAVLDLLSRSTGGRILPAHGSWQLGHAFAEIEQTLRSEYVVGYQPAHLKLDGSFRVVEILLRQANLRVRSRRGYYAPLETTIEKPF